MTRRTPDHLTSSSTVERIASISGTSSKVFENRFVPRGIEPIGSL
jgi:hypothetical protein